MAKGVTKSTTWKPGDPRASLAGKKSSRALPTELKEARLLNANMVEEKLYFYMNMPLLELQDKLKDVTTPSGDLIIIKIITEAIKHGDHHRMNFLYERTVGKVTDKTQITGAIGVVNLHDLIMKEIEDANK